MMRMRMMMRIERRGRKFENMRDEEEIQQGDM